MDGPKSEEKRDRDTCLKKTYAFWVLQLFKTGVQGPGCSWEEWT